MVAVVNTALFGLQLDAKVMALSIHKCHLRAHTNCCGVFLAVHASGCVVQVQRCKAMNALQRQTVQMQVSMFTLDHDVM